MLCAHIYASITCRTRGKWRLEETATAKCVHNAEGHFGRESVVSVVDPPFLAILSSTREICESAKAMQDELLWATLDGYDFSFEPLLD